MHLASEPAAVHEDEPLAALEELVRELHRDAAAQRVADEGRPIESERLEEVAHRVRVGPEGIVAARFRGFAVAEEIRGEDVVVLGEAREDGVPGGGGARDPVEQDDEGSASRPLIAVPLPVQEDRGGPGRFQRPIKASSFTRAVTRGWVVSSSQSQPCFSFTSSSCARRRTASLSSVAARRLSTVARASGVARSPSFVPRSSKAALTRSSWEASGASPGVASGRGFVRSSSMETSEGLDSMPM